MEREPERSDAVPIRGFPLFPCVTLCFVYVAVIFIIIGAVAPDWLTATPAPGVEVYHGLFELCTTLTRQTQGHRSVEETEQTTCGHLYWPDRLTGTAPHKMRMMLAFTMITLICAVVFVVCTTLAIACFCARRGDVLAMFTEKRVTRALDGVVIGMVLFGCLASCTFLGIYDALEIYPKSSLSSCPLLIMAGWCIGLLGWGLTRADCAARRSKTVLKSDPDMPLANPDSPTCHGHPSGCNPCAIKMKE